MSAERIKKFNHIVGNAPVGIDGDPNKAWEQIQLLSRLTLEEAQELYDASNSKDILEVLDGSEDVYYLRTYMDCLLHALGVDYLGARHAVAENNEGKYTTSKELAEKTAATIDGATVSETCYNGTTYYVVKNSFGKVQKLLTHVRPDLSKFIPEQLKEKLK